MPTIIHRLDHDRLPCPAQEPGGRLPHYDCIDLPHALKLVVFVPGTDAGGVEISSQGPDLFVTARKPHHVRANWQALHLENVQRDYELKLRLGSGFDFDALQASVIRNVLTIVLPKKPLVATHAPLRQRQVA